ILDEYCEHESLWEQQFFESDSECDETINKLPLFNDEFGILDENYEFGNIENTKNSENINELRFFENKSEIVSEKYFFNIDDQDADNFFLTVYDFDWNISDGNNYSSIETISELCFFENKSKIVSEIYLFDIDDKDADN